jgi:excisionase family DNA binding protein
MTDETYYTVKQIAELLHVHPETVRQWIRSGELRGFLMGGTKSGFRVPASELNAFIERRKRGESSAWAA